MKVFLGGTVNDSLWRDYVMPKLKIDHFNPVVEDWNEEAYQKEIYEREHADYCLYVITPRMEGFYSLAEVVEDSYKKTDKTIFCYLETDRDKSFSGDQLEAMENIGRKVTENGAVWKKSLDDVIQFLNSAARTSQDTGLADEFNDVFISYGRRHSLAFAHKLHNRLKSQGYDIWFDMNDIPVGVDFQEQIDNGIKKAHNFVFVISPHSVKSVYCLKEIVLALKYNKRIIPILHVEPTDCWDQMHPVISKLNWIYFRQQEDFGKPLDAWEFLDDFDKSFKSLTELINRHNDFTRLHTILLDKALIWKQQQNSSRYLLVGKERKEAMKWMLRVKDPKGFKGKRGKIEQPPCLPTDLHAEFVCQSRKNGENLQTDVFLLYDRADLPVKEQIRNSLNRFGTTSWSDTTDIPAGSDFENAIDKGMEGADNVVFILSPNSVNSKYCHKELSYARAHNKRIIPLLITPIEEVNNLGEIKWLETIQYIEFIDREERAMVDVQCRDDVVRDVEARKDKTPYEKSLDNLLNVLSQDKTYYNQHKVFLVQSLRWKRKDCPDSMLLRGYNLENALAWLKTSGNKSHQPLEIQKEYIETSYAKSGTMQTEVFVSYSRTDSDFARKINRELQAAGKTCWFDQESIAAGADFQQEIFKGIETGNNFLFIISPDSVNSPYCEDEVEYASLQSKRFVSILYRKTDPKTIPKKLASVQWIDFRQDFDKSFAELLRTLDTDREYVEDHTKWAKRAKDWEDDERPTGMLLSGFELESAEEWLHKSDIEHKKPTPTALQREYITASNEYIIRSKQKNLRRVVVAVAIGAAFAISVGIFGLVQKAKADKALTDLIQQQYQKHLTQGDAYLKEGRYEHAIEQYVSAKNLNYSKQLEKRIDAFKQANILLKKADSLILAGDLKRAKFHCENAVLFDSIYAPKKQQQVEAQINKQIDEYIKLSRLLIAAKERKDARKMLKLAQSLRPDDNRIKDLLKVCR